MQGSDRGRDKTLVVRSRNTTGGIGHTRTPHDHRITSPYTAASSFFFPALMRVTSFFYVLYFFFHAPAVRNMLLCFVFFLSGTRLRGTCVSLQTPLLGGLHFLSSQWRPETETETETESESARAMQCADDDPTR
jgi:hypothetical protein